MGGNFCCAVPCSDTPPICITAGAEVVLAGPQGKRSLPATGFHRGVRETVLGPGEILTEIRLPAQPPHSGASYQRFGLRRGMALAVAAVAARVDLVSGRIDGARIVMSAVAPVPLAAKRAEKELEGKKPDPDVLARAAAIAAEESQPIDDLRGSIQYRRELVQVLTTEALTLAATRAAGGGS
jgi:carbon-monoxide dehydrogenase medium subunit